MTKTISASELDRLFDEGKENILPYFDLSAIARINDPASHIANCRLNAGKDDTTHKADCAAFSNPLIA